MGRCVLCGADCKRVHCSLSIRLTVQAHFRLQRVDGMFENLTERLSQTLRHVTGQARLSDDNIKDAMRDVRMALLEADVALPVVKDFVEAVRTRAVGQEVSKSLSPGQMFVKIVQQELEHIMGDKNEALNFSTQPPAVVLMAGLQGAGKTTSVGKLAKYLKKKKKKKKKS